MQHVVQVGHYAYLSTFNGALCVTTSGAHATRYDNEAAALAGAQAFEGNRTAALASSATTPAFRTLAATLPVTTLPASELDARLSSARSDRSEYKAAIERSAKALAPKAERAPGVTRQIYQWVLDHPQASKADALAAFPSANPSTVGVQFGAARKSQRG